MPLGNVLLLMPAMAKRIAMTLAAKLG